MDRYPPLVECIALIPDPRHARGVRHPLVALLALACAATLCGYRSYSAMAEWGRTYGVEIRRALGFTRDQAPCAATFYQLFRRLDRVALEACLGGWAQQALAVLPKVAEEVAGPAGVAMDGKTLRGSRKQGAPLTVLLGYEEFMHFMHAAANCAPCTTLRTPLPHPTNGAQPSFSFSKV